MQNALKLRVFQPHDTKLRTYLITDASQTGISAYIAQGPIDGNWKDSWPIECFNRRFTNAENNYGTTTSEKLAIVESLRHFEHYLRGMDFTICTDHSALIHQGRGTATPSTDRREARWNEYISSSGANWQHIQGTENILADALSRVWEGYKIDNKTGESKTEIDDERTLWRWNTARIAATQLNENVISTMMSEAEIEDTKARLSKLEFIGDNIVEQIINGYPKDNTYKKVHEYPERYPGIVRGPNDILIMNPGSRIIIPKQITIGTKKLTDILINHVHEELAHTGVRATAEEIRKSFYWVNIREDVQHFIQQCDMCQRAKNRTTKPPGFLQAMPITSRPWASIAQDFVGPLPKNTYRNVEYDTIWVRMCRSTGMVKLEAIKSTDDAGDFAVEFIKRHYSEFGIPESIISDRDTRWTGKFWKAVTEKLPTTLKMSTAFHPETDGQVERRNRVIGETLRCLVDKRQTNWLESLPLVEFALNASVSSTTGYTAFHLNYGYTPTSLSADLSNMDAEGTPAAQRFLNEIDMARADAADAIRISKIRQTIQANKSRAETPIYHIGDLVMLSSKNITSKTGGARKLQDKWIGPFRVLNQKGAHVHLDLPNNWSIFDRFHVSLVKKYRGKAPINPPPEIDGMGNEAFEIEELQNMRYNKRRKRHEWLVKWVGWAPIHNTWEPLEHLDNCPELLMKYRNKFGDERK